MKQAVVSERENINNRDRGSSSNNNNNSQTSSSGNSSSASNSASLVCPVCMVTLKPSEVNAHFYKEVHEMETYRNALR